RPRAASLREPPPLSAKVRSCGDGPLDRQSDASIAHIAQPALLLGRQPATVAMARRVDALLESRHLRALVELERAARAEMAALGRRQQRRRQPGDRRQAFGPRAVDAGDRAEQPPRIGMLRVVEDLVEGSLLD